MTREEKAKVIDELSAKIEDNSVIYLADISGLNAKETYNLRKACFNADVKLSVVKNKLLEKAMEKVERDFGDLSSVLKGNTSLMLGNVGNAPAKLIKDFRKKQDKPILKGAYVEETTYLGDENLDLLVAIKSKNELIGEVIGLLQSPAKNVISALQSGGGNLAGILKTLSEK